MGNEVAIQHNNIILRFDNLMMNNGESKSFQDFMTGEGEENTVSERLELPIYGPENRSNHADFI